ncbi:MAG: hypothetical protein OEW85_05125 [Acidimicrobiia bacterium]|nr:hypothetical protein [Acidimicrobiia bacterium]
MIQIDRFERSPGEWSTWTSNPFADTQKPLDDELLESHEVDHAASLAWSSIGCSGEAGVARWQGRGWT